MNEQETKEQGLKDKVVEQPKEQEQQEPGDGELFGGTVPHGELSKSTIDWRSLEKQRKAEKRRCQREWKRWRDSQ